MLVVVDEAALPFGRLRARRAGIGGRPQRPEVGHRRVGHRPSSRGCGWGWGVATGGGTSRTTCWRRFEGGEKAELEEIIARAADAVEMFAAADIDKVMNTYNPETAGPELD